MLFAVLILVALISSLAFWTILLASDADIVIHSPSPASNLVPSNPKILQKSTLEERSVPNRRLVQVFGIDNAFTTTDEAYWKSFTADVRIKLKTSGDDWKLLALAVEHYISHNLKSLEDPAESIDLSELVQITVFKAVMFKFFPQLLLPSDLDIRLVTTLINERWIKSKDCAYLASNTSFLDRLELNSTLRQIFCTQPSEQIHGRDNPLNIILPAYETLWRIVLRLFLEVRFRSSSETQYHEYIQTFKLFLTQPDRLLDLKIPLPSAPNYQGPIDEVNKSISHKPSSMRAIVNEGLRLYPPTRRIYRQINNEKVAVDVEALHRDLSFWGEDALEFRPSRWLGMKPRSSDFLPFGCGVFECPAKASFGPTMIGVLVATLAVKIGEGYELTGKGAKEVLKGEAPMCNGRNGLKGLCVGKIERA